MLVNRRVLSYINTSFSFDVLKNLEFIIFSEPWLSFKLVMKVKFDWDDPQSFNKKCILAIISGYENSASCNM